MNQFLIAALAFLLLHSIHFPKPVEKPEIAISRNLVFGKRNNSTRS